MKTERKSDTPSRRPARILFASLLLLVGVLSWRSIADLDYGIHLASGRWIVEEGRVPSADPFTWTVSDHEYVAYHWLFQVILFFAVRLFGEVGPVALRALVWMATFILLADVLRRRRANISLAAAVGLLAVLACEWRFTMRPELASTFLLAATIWVFERARAGEHRLLWAFVPLQLVWINTHIFVFGWIVAFCYLAEEWIDRRRIDKKQVIPLIVAGAVLFFNPYHYRAVLYPLLLATRMDSGNIFAERISELASPFALASDPRFPFSITTQLLSYKILLALAAIAAIGLLRERRLGQVALLLLFGLLSATAIRNIPLFAIVAVPAIVRGIEAMLPAAKGKKRKSARRNRRVARLGGLVSTSVALLAILTATRVVGGSFYDQGRRAVRFEASVNTNALAVETADWIATHQLRGRGYNSLNVGGTLIWRDPARKVFIDGRNEVTGEDFFRRYLDLSTPQGWKRGERSYGFDYAVIAHRAAMPLARFLHADPLWRLVHADAVAAVFIRVGGANDHISPYRFPTPLGEAERRSLLDSIEIETNWASKAARWMWSKEPPPGRDHFLGVFFLMLGKWTAAERPLLAAASISPHYAETSNNLGALYYRLGRWSDALLCYRRTLELQPGNPHAAGRIAEIRAKRR